MSRSGVLKQPVTTIELVDVEKRYGKDVMALRGVSAVVRSGVATGIVGESGSGKSTLGRMIVGLSTPTSGSVLVDGNDLGELLSWRTRRAEYLRTVQLVAQDTTTTFDPRHKVRDSIRRPAQILRGLDRSAADAQVDEIAAELGIDPELVDRYPGQLSGGQRQRLSIARALIVKPKLLVCDEAVSALDISAQAVVLNLLKCYVTTHSLGMVFISHGLPATAFITEELLVMKSGRLVDAGRTAEVLRHPQHPYTRQLVESYRRIDSLAV